MFRSSLCALLALFCEKSLATTRTLIISGDSSGGAFSATFNDLNHDFSLTGSTLDNGANWIALVGTSRAYLTFRNTSFVAAYDVSSFGGLAPAGAPVTVPVPVYVGVSRNGGFIFTASYPSGAIATVPVSPEGIPIPPAVTTTFAAPDPLPSPQDQARPHSGIVDVTGQYLIFPDDGLDVLHVYKIGATSATFLYDQPSPVRPSGPRHAVLSGFPVVPNWIPRVHVVNEEDNSVETWIMHYTPNNVSLILQGSAVSTLKVHAGMNVSTAAELLISPNGKFLLASNRDAIPLGDGSIAVFRINPPTAKTALTRVSITSSGGANPRSMSLDPTGKWLAVVNGNSNSTAMFIFNQETGVLASTPVANLTGITIPQTVVWLEDRETPTATETEILRLQRRAEL
ncbi:Lactonase, 7-bladed beta-propeller-domain-containing protein [Mycena alexandri]|uniref:Lactonase, 7-bladed beta-propeller-domain-containing protein n=1 Tax=Mycena alexandri TaxID=1745969 RepID=A0AAD6XGF5_9AGAR|nr:Lactonase, 7-bladed beta-propeller-domain-containing protein [Mycena alexandri]